MEINRNTVEPFIEIEEAKRILRMSKSKIYKLTSSKRIPHYKHGKLKFLASELAEWRERRRRG